MGFSKSTPPTLNNKRLALLLSFVGQARLQFARLHSRLLFLWCVVVSTMLGYLLLRMLCCGICTTEIFAIADTFLDAVVSVWLRYSILQMLFWMLRHLHD